MKSLLILAALVVACASQAVDVSTPQAVEQWGIQDFDPTKGKPHLPFGRFGLGLQKRNVYASGMRQPLTYELLEPAGYRPKVNQQVHEPLPRIF